MAARAKKPAGSTEKKARGRPRKPANGSGEERPHGANGISAEAVREYFDELHSCTDRMEEENATARGDIKAIYDRAAEKLDVTREGLKFLFKEERRKRKQAAQVARMDSRGRDTLRSVGHAMGGGLGEWAVQMADIALAPEPETEGEAAEE